MSDENLNPIIQFKEWFNLAISKEINDPNAMCLSTISSDNKPHSRMVLLKDYNDEGFVFYTNYESNKGNDISINSNVCLNFHWKSLLRQVRIEGTIEKLSEEISDKYYNSRHYLSRIGAWASDQSRTLNNRKELEEKIEFYKEKFGNEKWSKVIKNKKALNKFYRIENLSLREVKRKIRATNFFNFKPFIQIGKNKFYLK